MNHVPPNVTNVAMDDAHVEAQIGYVHGDVTIYSLSSGDPRHKYETGLRYLEGDNPRQAERLIEEAAMAGHRSAEVAYHWVLAILSDRSFDHLGQEEFRRLHIAITMAHEFPRDAWRDALDVVIELVNCLDEETNGPSDSETLTKALERYTALPQERQDEIHRHLDMVLNGWIQDKISELQAQYVQRMRFANNREQRVWKFFEPVPMPPRKAVPPPPAIAPADRGRIIAGCVLGGFSLFIITAVLLFSAPAHAVVACTLAGLWVLITVTMALPRRRLRHPASQGWWNERFAQAVSDSVDHWFRVAGPQDPAGAARWAADSERLRAQLKEDLVLRYGADLSRVGPIRWLIRWHAHTTAERFFTGRIRLPVDETSVPLPVRASKYLLYVAILLGLAGSVEAGAGMLVFWGLLAVGALVSGSELLDYAAARQRYQREAAEAEQRYAGELQEYERWRQVLADRPSDIEMATWLAYDKLTFKSWALREYGLSNRDVLAHLILTEAAPNSRRARVPYGPPRYSAYTVLLFLLTEGGVRQVTATLDFATGRFYNQRRDTFRYDMIASARVEEVGVRFEAGNRRVVAREEMGPYDHQALILRRAFRLSLVNNQDVNVLVDGFEEGAYHRMPEDHAFLEELAMNSSGVSGALRILESVCAEGREWLALERARRRRRLQDFRESGHVPGAIGFLRRSMLTAGPGEKPAPDAAG